MSQRFGIREVIEEKGMAHIFKDVSHILTDGHIVIGNLECALSKSSRYDDIRKDFLRGEPEYANALKGNGFSILSISNNHIFDHGLEAASETKRSLNDVGIDTIGYDTFNHQSRKGKIIEIANTAFGFLSFCLNLGSLHSIVSPPSIEDIEVCIKEMRRKVDYVILSLHWGFEYTDMPSPEQVEIAHRFIDSGVDVILGHHPHVLQPIEKYHGGIIAYSLGNFIFNQYYHKTKASVILKIFFEGENIEIQTYPVRINELGIPSCEGVSKDLGLLNTQTLIGLLPNDYSWMSAVENKRYRRFLFRNFCQNFWKYRKNWYKFMVFKKVSKLKKKRNSQQAEM